MADPGSADLANVEEAISDCGDVFLVLGLVLAAGALTDATRDALATVARLGSNRAQDAWARLDRIAGGRRG